MADKPNDKFAAGEQALGYIYQGRLALLLLLQQPEDTGVLIEKDDDLDFVNAIGGNTLGSLKHKAIGDKLSDLSSDFWKSVRIWLSRYQKDGFESSKLRFILFTTGVISAGSFLERLRPDYAPHTPPTETIAEAAQTALAESKSKLSKELQDEINLLNVAQREDFFSRISILESGPRAHEIPDLIKDKHMRSVKREHRTPVFEQLEGWWNDVVIKILSGHQEDPVFGFQVSDRLAAFADQYKSDNLPITFTKAVPDDEVDVDEDPRQFVLQLRLIGVSTDRIRRAILDYYRAFEQRSAWARENLLVSGEIEEYEDKIADEWSRFKDVVFEDLDENTAEEALRAAGSALFRWAEFDTGRIESLRIRARVTEPYVLRGSFHMLADAAPTPRVYWHPRFLERVGSMLGATA